MKMIRKNGPLFCSWLGTSPELAIMTPEHLEIIMNNSVHITKGDQYKLLVPWLGQGLLTSTGMVFMIAKKIFPFQLQL